MYVFLNETPLCRCVGVIIHFHFLKMANLSPPRFIIFIVCILKRFSYRKTCLENLNRKLRPCLCDTDSDSVPRVIVISKNIEIQVNCIGLYLTDIHLLETSKREIDK